MTQPIHALYVDDDPILLKLGKIYLERIGDFTVTTAPGSIEAIFLLKDESFDVIISDYEMPEMDGIAFLKHLKAEGNSTPFILFTGRGREEVVIEALNNGADFYLQKGGEPKSQFAELSNKIHSAVSRRRTETDLLRKNEELQAAYEQIAASEEELRSNINELTRQEQVLRESEEKFRAMVETIPVAIYLSEGKEQKCEYVNPTFVSLFGYTLEDIPTVEQWWPLAYPDEQYRQQISEEWTKRVHHATDSQSPMEPMEVMVTCKDGCKKHILWDYITLGEKNYACGLDLTDRRRTEETLRLQTITLSVLNDIITTANRADNLPQLLENILDTLLHLLDFDAGGIYLVNNSTRTADVVYSKNLSSEFLDEIQTISIDKTPYDTLFIHNQPIITENYAQISPERSKKNGFLSVASIPLLSKQNAIGALNIVSTRRHVINDEEKQTLISIGRELGSTIGRMRTEEELQKKNEELHSAFEKISANEERLRLLSDNLPNGTVYQLIIEPDGKRRFAYMSAGVQQIHGVTQEDVLQDPLLLYHQILEEDQRCLKEAEDRAFSNKSPFTLETRFLAPNGQIRWALLQSMPRELPDGTVLWDGFEIDITEQKITERELREKEANLLAIIENTSDIIALYDSEVRLLIFNQACSDNYRQLFGVELYSGLRTIDLFPEFQRSFWDESNTRALSGESFSIEFSVPLPNGQERYFESFFNPIWNETGVVGFSTFTRDITERNRAEEAMKRQYHILTSTEEELRKAKKYLENLISIANVPIIVWDPSFRITRLNHAFELLIGRSEDEVIGKFVSSPY